MGSITSLAREIGVETLYSLPRDVSPREYFRGRKDDRDFILMLYPDASEAHCADLQSFIRIGAWLNTCGVKVPALYDKDEVQCYALFEDLGTQSFGARLRDKPDDQQGLYRLATDVLKILGQAQGTPDTLPLYTKSKIHAGHRQIVDYYIPLLGRAQGQADAQTVQAYLSVWDEIESTLPPCPQGFVHGDFHLENMIYVGRENGVKRCGLIDYQDALYGPLPYDLVNLLEDARVDVPIALRDSMIAHYSDGMSAQDKAAFLDWYRVLGTQFHCRVIGLFIKLSAEQGRDSYLVHIPRLQNYILNALENPILSPLKLWFEKEGVDFNSIKDLDGNIIRKIFSKRSVLI